MSKKEFIKDDMVKLLGGASSALGVLKDELEDRIKDKVEKVIFKLDLINKKDFLVVKKMAEEARIQNEKLSKKINTLEKKIVLLNKKFKK
ncbi:MAG: accessory factor UbiK family protein [Alphaproteobacteria bacterium]|tara:strand:+ start:1493 stop:1762 length:270 start_codon:yes stop_codon:yes gene_type:complete